MRALTRPAAWWLYHLLLAFVIGTALFWAFYLLYHDLDLDYHANITYQHALKALGLE